MGRVLRTRSARRDLEEIAEYIAETAQNHEAALNFLDKIEQSAALHARHPKKAEACPDLGSGMRRFVVGRYLVFYRPIDGGIEIIRVLHSSRDIPVAWRERGDPLHE